MIFPQAQPGRKIDAFGPLRGDVPARSLTGMRASLTRRRLQRHRPLPLLACRVPPELAREARTIAKLLGLGPTQLVRRAVMQFCARFRRGELQ